MGLKYICYDNSSKPMYLKIRALIQTEVHDTELVGKTFGFTGTELRECYHGIVAAINRHPRINSGFLSSYFRVEMEVDSIKVFHVSVSDTDKRKLICEVVKTKEGGEQWSYLSRKNLCQKSLKARSLRQLDKTNPTVGVVGFPLNFGKGVQDFRKITQKNLVFEFVPLLDLL